MYVGENAGVDATTTVIDDAISAHERLDSHVTDIDTAKPTGVLPPLPTLVGPDSVERPKGTDLALTVRLVNPGSPTDSALTVTTDAGFEVSVSPSEAGPLDTDTTEHISLTGTLSEAGRHRVEVTASNDAVDASQVIDVTVVAKASFLSRAIGQVDAMRTFLDDDPDDGHEGLENRLTELERRLEKIERNVESGHRRGNRSINNQIHSCINRIDSLRTRVDRDSGAGLSDSVAARIQTELTRTRTNLESSIDAQP